MKFKSGRLKKFEHNIDITFDEAKITKELVAISDNQFLRSIRDIRNANIDYEKLEEAFTERDSLRRKKHSVENKAEIQRLQNIIRDYLFVPDYITVEIEHPKHYEYIYLNGLIVNGKPYKRLSCSTGQARGSTVVLCNIEIIDELKRRINNGRDESIPITPSKFNAYFGLAGSSTFIVSEPKFIVIKDYINKDKFMANYVTETEWDKDDIIDQREIELEMNRTDGMGLISYNQSKRWADELGLDYIPAQWCVRQSFLKGMLCTFPIHEFCEKVNNGNYIVDTIYKDNAGNHIKADLRNYDIIITESQFKLWNSYPDIESYIENCRNNKLYWGVSRYTDKQDKDMLKLNYQFIQTLDLKKRDVQKISKQFVEWIDGVTLENLSYTLLFLLGVNNNEEKIYNYLKSNDNYWVKSLVVSPEILNDKYIRDKIYNLLRIRIQKGCLGDIYVNGNFQVLVYDPYAFMQHVCGLEITGLLKRDEFYSHYWNNIGVSQISSMRSPLTYRSEHVVLNLRNDEI